MAIVRAQALEREAEASLERSRRQSRLALSVGALTTLGALLVGWIAHVQSRSVVIESVFMRNLGRAHALAASIDRPSAMSAAALRDDALAAGLVDARAAGLVDGARAREASLAPVLAEDPLLLASFGDKRLPGALPGEYLCVVDGHGRVVVNTGRRDVEGSETGSMPFRGEGPGPATLLELIDRRKDWVGHYSALDGTRQLAAFVYMPRANALASIHVPWSSVEREIRRFTWPWTIGVALLALVLMPSSLMLLHRAYRRSYASWRVSQAALHESEARMLAAVESLPFDFWMLDRDGTCVMQNSASRRAHGDQSGKRLEDMPLSAETRARWIANNERAFSGELVVDYGDEPGPAGRRRCQTLISPVRQGGRTIGVLGLNIDVTELHRAEEAQRSLAQRLWILRDIDKAVLAARSLEEIAHNALHKLGQLHPIHRMSVTLFEGSRARVLAVSISGSAPASIARGEILPIAGLGLGDLSDLRAGIPYEAEDLDSAADLPPLLARIRAAGVRSLLHIPLISQGELFGTLNLGLDRPGRVDPGLREVAVEVADMLAVAIRDAQLEARLVEQAAELERRVLERTRALSAANEELEGYVHTVSHDLRAPLRAIQGFGQALREDAGAKLDPQSLAHLERMIDAAERMDRLMLDLLDYSRLGRAELAVARVDTAALVAEATAMIGPELDRALATVAIEEPLLPLVAHGPTLVQALVNLLGNAAKFVAPGVIPVIRVRTELRDAFVRLSVCDNGIGIAPENQAKIFHVFVRLHGVGAYPGTGIGLAIVRRVVEKMGGRVGVDSYPGEGSTFWIELPSGDGER